MPWELGTWWIVGIGAALASAVSILFRETRDGSPRPIVQLIFSIIAVLLWFLWSINAFAVIQINQGTGEEIIRNYTGLGLVGLLISAIMLLDLMIAVLTALGYDIDLLNSGPMQGGGLT